MDHFIRRGFGVKIMEVRAVCCLARSIGFPSYTQRKIPKLYTLDPKPQNPKP